MHKRNLWVRFVDNLPTIGGALVIIAVVALLALGIIAAIHSIPILHEGTVVDKTYRAAHTEVIMMSITDDKGNNTIYPQTHYYPDKWSIQVSGITAEDEPRVEWWEVGAGLFGEIAIGDRVYRDTKSGVVNTGRKAVAEDAPRGD